VRTTHPGSGSEEQRKRRERGEQLQREKRCPHSREQAGGDLLGTPADNLQV